jgi:hypothetical protein
MLIWNTGTGSGTCLHDYLDLPPGASVDAAIATLEAAAGTTGEWDYDEDSGWSWWGLVGTFDGATFTVYTHKSGSLHIGSYRGFGRPAEALDITGLKAALLALVA